MVIVDSRSHSDEKSEPKNHLHGEKIILGHVSGFSKAVFQFFLWAAAAHTETVVDDWLNGRTIDGD